VEQSGCTSAQDCFAQCGPIINGNPAAIPALSQLLNCSQNVGCPRCARPVPVPPPIFDAGVVCRPPPFPNGPTTCGGTVGNGTSCATYCNDNSNKYSQQCANGSCSCIYDGTEICRCSYNQAAGCYSCCPPWGPVLL
jgi:hypothetical protein